MVGFEQLLHVAERNLSEVVYLPKEAEQTEYVSVKKDQHDAHYLILSDEDDIHELYDIHQREY
jgi:hypothetical protein